MQDAFSIVDGIDQQIATLDRGLGASMGSMSAPRR